MRQAFVIFLLEVIELKKIFNLAILIFIFALSLEVQAQEVWRLDGSAENTLPRNFRVMYDSKTSASGQPSVGGIKLLCNALKNLADPDANIYIIDLREESHGFADSLPVSFYVDKNRGNYYSGYDLEREFEQLSSLLGKFTEFLPLGNTDKKNYTAQSFAPENIYVERVLVLAEDCIYVRIPATDMIFPSPQVVDQFLNFVQSLKPNDWLHFHCQAGHGRTTTFLVMYDILKNPDKSLEEICSRQVVYGGSDLLAESSGTDFYSQAQNERARLIKLFYKYAHQGTGNWSEWIIDK